MTTANIYSDATEDGTSFEEYTEYYDDLTEEQILALIERQRGRTMPEDDNIIDSSPPSRNTIITNYIEDLNKLSTPENITNAYKYAKGSFTYTSSGKNQIYNMTILDVYDAILVSTLFSDIKRISPFSLPQGYQKIYNLINDVLGRRNFLPDTFILEFRNKLEPYFKIPINHYLINIKRRMLLSATQSNYNNAIKNAKGKFTYNTRAGKRTYKMDIKSKYDAIIIAVLLTNKNIIKNREELPAGYRYIYGSPYKEISNIDDLIINFKDELLKYFPEISSSNKVVNPITKRLIKYDSATYKSIFGKIKLKNVISNNLDVYNTIDYNITNYCVPSYLQEYLTKKQYSQINGDLDVIKTPTYIELTNLLNKINIGLEVRIIDNEIIQQQTGYKKTLKIMIHNEHMYVLPSRKQLKKYTEIKLNRNDFEKKYSELMNGNKIMYSNNSILDNDIKYVLESNFTSIKKDYDYQGTYSHINTHFYEHCDIRAPKYFNGIVKNATCLDIVKCYPNILKNTNYVFGICDGTEKIETYNNIIVRSGFYYVKFKKYTYIDSLFFSEESWIYGDVILMLNLDDRINIIYQHIPRKFENGKITNHSNLDLVLYSGTLGAHIKYDSTNYDISDNLELIAMKKKYNIDSYIIGDSLTIQYSNYKNKTGKYAYLSIISYSTYQLYKICEILNQKYKNFKVRRIYTDSISFNYDMEGEEELNKLNLQLKNYNILVDYEGLSNNIFTTRPPLENILKPENNNIITSYKREDILKLVSDNKSFAIFGKAGYGKTYIINNVIIPYLKENNKQYILSSTTSKNAEYINGVTIQGLLFKKGSSIKNVKEKLKDISYIIIDESSQITANILYTLNTIKDELNINIILIGDNNQCGSIDNINTWFETDEFLNCINRNIVYLEWIETGRYSREFDKKLNNFLICSKKCKNNIEYINLIKLLFGKSIIKECDNKNKKYLVWSHNKGKTLKEKTTNDYLTVHSVQGESIDISYTIYEWYNMPINVLYTALSRACDEKYISLAC